MIWPLSARPESPAAAVSLRFFFFLFLTFIYLFIYFNFYFTTLYWFCHTLTWIHHGCMHPFVFYSHTGLLGVEFLDPMHQA